MNLINKSTRLKLRKSLLNSFRSTIKAIHGIQADVCGIWAVDNIIYWETSHTNGRLDSNQPIEFLVRKQVGQNLLTLAGIPQEKEDIPTVYLAPFLSLIKVIGLKRYLKLIKEWPGKSMAMDIEVVRYKLK